MAVGILLTACYPSDDYACNISEPFEENGVIMQEVVRGDGAKGYIILSTDGSDDYTPKTCEDLTY